MANAECRRRTEVGVDFLDQVRVIAGAAEYAESRVKQIDEPERVAAVEPRQGAAEWIQARHALRRQLATVRGRAVAAGASEREVADAERGLTAITARHLGASTPKEST